jgi:CheY-like chemotaxis protein
MTNPGTSAADPRNAATLRDGLFMPKLLILDDDEALLRALRRQLGRRYEVETARTAADAYALLERERFDAILCDLQMPDVNGLDVYLHLQKTRPDLAQRMIFMTGQTGSALDRIMRGTDNPRLTKPIDVTELANLVKSVALTLPPNR